MDPIGAGLANDCMATGWTGLILGLEAGADTEDCGVGASVVLMRLVAWVEAGEVEGRLDILMIFLAGDI